MLEQEAGACVSCPMDRDDFFQLFNWSLLFFSVKKRLKVVGNCQNSSEITFLKGDVDGFSYFIF